ncbi:MAG: lysophospholipase [Candidatus Thorarchaeota archaeon]
MGTVCVGIEMQESQSEYTGFDGKKMFLRKWSPDGEPRGVMIGIHGLGDHSGGIEFTAEYFVSRGMAFYAPDLRGFGHFDGLKGHIESFDNYLDDIHSLVLEVKENTPDQKIFLYGQSFGGLVGVHYAGKYQETLDGMIIPSPAVSEQLTVNPVTRLFLKLLSRVNVKKHFDTGLNLDVLARNPEVVRKKKEDTMRFDKATPRMAAEGLNASQTAIDIAPLITIPVIVQQAGEDLILIPEKNKEFFDAIASEDKTWKLYEGMYHLPFQDPGGDEIMSDMYEWLNAHL